ncbi:MAG: PorT family protein, partial [Saprospiraceae bacterium]|nr:PorT family protein [Saprospiraceae bacterium]
VLPLRDMPLSGQPAKPRGTVPPWTSHHRERRVQVGIVAGGQLAYTPHYIWKKFGGSLTFGLSANYQLTPRWSVQADVLYRVVPYKLRTNFGQIFLDASGQYNSWTYGGGSNDLEFIEMPLLVKRAFFKGNAHWLAGLRPAFIRPVHITAAQWAIGPYANANMPGFSPSFHNGVRRFDLAFTLGGELRIWRNLWIHARISQGVFDLTHDDFFQNTNADVTSDMHLSLRYYFFSFN